MPPRTRTVQAVIALPDLLLATSIAGMFHSSHSPAVTATSWAEMEDAIALHQPALVLSDVVVGTCYLLDYLHQLVTIHGGTRFVVCTNHPDPVLVRRALLSGATAVIGHGTHIDKLRDGFGCVLRGEPWPDDCGFRAATDAHPIAPLRALQPRHRQVAQLLWEGCLHTEIARELGISVKTVEAHTHAIRESYGVPPRMPAPWERGRRGSRGKGFRGN